MLSGVKLPDVSGEEEWEENVEMSNPKTWDNVGYVG